MATAESRKRGQAPSVPVPFFSHRLFLLILIAIALVGGVANGVQLFRHFYLWPLVRLVGYGSLLVYASLMLRKRGQVA